MDKKPNILLITTDQQRYDTIGAAGYEFMKTPNLDRLANEGCLYQYAFSPNPACIPARHNILTGLPSKDHGFDDNYFNNERQLPHDIPTFPEILSNAGYDTTAIGKMHFSPVRAHHGFNRMMLMEELPRFREDDDYALYLRDEGLGQFQSIHGVRHHLYMLPQQSFIPTKNHGSTWVADRTIEIMKENNGNRPFMIWTSFIQPHPPFDVPPEWSHLYDDVELPEYLESGTPISAIAEENRAIAEYPNEESRKRAVQLYYCAISYVDHQVGRILDELERLDQLDNTLIVFTSDHGEMLGENGTYQKFLPYDGSSRVPMIVRYPKCVQGGTKSTDFVDLNDLLPTFIDAADAVYPSNHKLPGESLLAMNESKKRDCQYVEHNKGNKRWVSLRDHSYKYNYYYSEGCEELFDMDKDNKEQHNLLHDKSDSFKSVRDRMRSRLIEYEQSWGLDGYVHDGDFICLEHYEPKPLKERNYPMHTKYLVGEDRHVLLSVEDEMSLAVKDEPSVKLSEIDMSTDE